MSWGACSGAAQSENEAEHICEALRAAGIVLKVGDLVYLRPQEVTAMVMRVRLACCVAVGPRTEFSYAIEEPVPYTVMVVKAGSWWG